MKRILSLILAAMMVLSLCACDGDDEAKIKKAGDLGKDMIGGVGKVIDDHKDELINGFEELQKVAGVTDGSAG